MPSQNDDLQDLSKPLPPAWPARRASESLFIEWRGLRHHVRRWPAEQAGAPGAAERTVFLLHGWMDVSASFQFVVDCLPAHWTLLAPDWRGFGLTERSPADCYWFPDYLADLDGLLDAFAPEGALDLVAHSMGGNIACLYAGIRPERVRRLVNLEGFGMRPTVPTQAPGRYREWLDGLRRGATLRDYDSRDAVARRLLQNNPRLDPAKAVWLAQHWAQPGEDGRFVLAGDPAHRLPNPVLYRVEEANAIWAEIAADVLWVYAEHTGPMQRYIHESGYEERLQRIRSLRRETVAGAGHMLHHDQPVAVAALIEEFLA